MSGNKRRQETHLKKFHLCRKQSQTTLSSKYNHFMDTSSFHRNFEFYTVVSLSDRNRRNGKDFIERLPFIKPSRIWQTNTNFSIQAPKAQFSRSRRPFGLGKAVHTSPQNEYQGGNDPFRISHQVRQARR